MRVGESTSDRRKPSLVLISLTLFLVLLPLTLSKPGLPPVLKADEASYYLASLSLWNDGDLVCDDGDARRLFREYLSSGNVLLMGKGGDQPAYFSVPIIYPLVATPFVALFGANGMVMLNAALLMAMVWMGVSYLRRHNEESVSLLFGAGFFLLSTAFVYVFWLQAEVFNMACVMAAFYLIERSLGGSGRPDEPRHPSRRIGRVAAGAAALLAVVIYSKPMLVVLALPLLYRLVRTRSWRGLGAFAASGVLTTLAIAGVAYGLTEQVWPYFAPRAGISLSSPIEYVERRVAPRFTQEPPADSPVSQITRGGKQLRVTLVPILRQAIPEFLLGRHGGFLIYMPFAVLSILYFFLRERHSGFRWVILASAVAAAVLFMVMVRGQWLGGGGFVGNRYFTPVYPAFLFLVRRLQPAWLTSLGYAAAAVFLGPLLITPLGAVVKYPTLQAHVRNEPFPRLPLEWSLVDSLGGYAYIPQGGVTFHGRRDEIAAHDGEVWIWGSRRVGMDLLSTQESQGFVFDVRNLAAGNEIELCLGDECQRLGFDDVPPEGSKQRVVFESQPGDRIPRGGRSRGTYKYGLTVASEWGEQPRWRGSGQERFYLGAALAFLGSPEELNHELFDVEWLSVVAPRLMEVASTVTFAVEIRNSSPHGWPSTGAARVQASYRWLSQTGDTVVRRGRRSELPADIAAGGKTSMEVVVDAPKTPGRYILELDLLRRPAGWFSKRDEGLVHRIGVEIVGLRPESADLED